MKLILSFFSIYFAAALIFNAQAQSSKSIRKTASTTTDSGPRTALVIGNAKYSSAPLKNPVNDARDIAKSLDDLGFDVTLLLDAGQNKMRRAINNFGRTLRDGGVGLFYFSGHGIQVDGKNFLIPVGASIESEDDVEIDSVAANRVLAKMNTARNSLNIVIMDACRNNPFARSFRSASRGLASMDAPKGTFIAYATATDNVASDGTGGNSPYTSALVQQLKKPGLKLEDVFKKVSAEVQIKTNGKQVPWVGSNFTGDFYFIPPTETSGDADLQYERQKLAEEKLLAAQRQKLAEQKESDLRYEEQKLAEEKRKVAAERRRIKDESAKKQEFQTYEKSDTKFRALIGSGSSGQTSFNDTSLYLVWGKWGFGLSSFSLETTASGGQKVEVQNQSLDLTYDYMDDITFTSFLDDTTLTLGLGIITNGEAKSTAFGTSPHGGPESFTKVSGYRFMGFLGKNFGKWELLGGYQYSTFSYEKLSSANDYSASGGLMVIGLGKEF